MKPILFIDANILAKFNYESLKKYIDNNTIILTDDIVKEIIAKEYATSDDLEFKKKYNLLFNSKGGLNDNIYLILSHLPIEIYDVYSNTKNKLDFKSKKEICSSHHLWLHYIVNPALITDFNTHLNSELTWRLKRGDIEFNDSVWQNIINKTKLNQIKVAKPYYEVTNINVNKLFNSWIKRDKDIIANKYKISDARLVVHALDLLIACQTNVRILSADYDVLDYTNNLFLSILEKYVVYETLKQECKLIDLKVDNRIQINVPISKINDVYDKTLKKFNESNNLLFLRIDFYNKEKASYDTFDNAIPDWLLEFIQTYKENVDCYALNEELYKKYPIQYIWYSTCGEYNAEYIKFEVWKRDISKYTNPMNEMECKPFCIYEMDEINNPENIGSFIDVDNSSDT